MVTIVVGTLMLVYIVSLIISHMILAKIDVATERELFGSMMLDGTESMYDLGALTLPFSDTFEGYTVHQTPGREVNAYATIGANILITE